MNNYKGKKLILLPIETSNREFLGKLRLAMCALDRGYDVLLGSNKSELFRQVKSGFLLYKDHSKWNAKLIESYKKNGLFVGVLDEEGHIIESEEKYLNDICDSHLMNDIIDIIFLWGNEQFKIIQKFGLKNKLQIAGNPRFDISSLYYKKNTLKRNSINVSPVLNILVNTRFAYTVGHIDQMSLLVRMGYLNNKEEIKNFNEFLINEDKILKEFIRLLECLGSMSDYRIIVRPHPNEKISFYEKKFSKFKNIKIDNSQELNEQIYWSDFVVHDGCTTALEAKCQGGNVLGLRPFLRGNVYPDDANKVSHNFQSYKDLILYLKTYRHGERNDLTKLDNELIDKVANWRNINLDSAKVILDKIDEFDLKEYQIKKLYLINFREMVYHIFLYYLKILADIRLPSGVKNKILMLYHKKSKFPPISNRKFKDYIAQLELLEDKKFYFECKKPDLNVYYLKKKD